MEFPRIGTYVDFMSKKNMTKNITMMRATCNMQSI